MSKFYVIRMRALYKIENYDQSISLYLYTNLFNELVKRKLFQHQKNSKDLQP